MKQLFTILLITSLSNFKAQSVSTIAGNGSGEASLNNPRGIVLQRSTGDIYFTDINNNKIKKISASTGSVTLYAGTGATGNTNGSLSSCVLNRAAGICIDNAGTNMYISESGGNYIKKIDMVANTISILAGSGTAGNANGTGTLATFNTPTDIDIDNNGNLYVADYGNNSIRKITPAGVVTTLTNNIISPHGLAVDKATGNVYTAGRGDHRVYKITSSGAVSLFAGKSGGGSSDGTGLTTASFYSPMDVDLDLNGNLYVAEEGGRIRRIKLSDTTVTTLVGKTAKSNQFSDGKADTVLVNYCTGVAVKDTTTIFLTSLLDNVVKKYSKVVQSTVSLSKNNLINSQLNFFPNPFQNQITINADATIEEVAIFDVSGRCVLKETPNNSSMHLTTENLSSGMYFIKLKVNDSEFIKQIIKE